MGGIHVTHVVDALIRLRRIVSLSNALQLGVASALGASVAIQCVTSDISWHTTLEGFASFVLAVNVGCAARFESWSWQEMKAHAESAPPYDGKDPYQEAIRKALWHEKDDEPVN